MIKKNKTKKIYMVIGSKTKNSLSPIIFNYWFKKYKINAKYVFKEIELKDFESKINLILDNKNIYGLNVTIPFKELIIKKIDKLDIHSKKIGAVNCIYRCNNNWCGSNTDWEGFIRSVKQIYKKKINKKALVFGYGGAAKAIIYSLKKSGFKEIKIYNRSLEKIKNINFDKEIKILNAKDIEQSINKTDIVINTTPINIIKPFVKKKDQKKIFAFDAVYNPVETDFLSHFVKKKRIYGLSMLIYQAAPCFKTWFGFKPRVDEGLLSLLKEKISK